MKGYLSRIARQSGHSFSSTGTILPRTGGEPHAGPPLEPIGREETLIVAQPVECNSSETGVVIRNTTSERHAPEHIELREDREIAMVRTSPEQFSVPTAGENTDSPVMKKTVPGVPEPGRSRSKQALPSDVSPVSASFESQSAETGQSVLHKSSSITRKHEKHPPDLRSAVAAEPVHPKEKSQKQYLKRVAEIIEGRVVEPIQVRTILFNEIKEWVAAGAAPDAVEVTAEDKSGEAEAFSAATIETKESVRITKPEAGVVRVGEQRQPASVTQEASRIDEQSFELSIGTINVVIEGDERPPQPITAGREIGRPNRIETGRGQSRRLGRNYL